MVLELWKSLIDFFDKLDFFQRAYDPQPEFLVTGIIEEMDLAESFRQNVHHSDCDQLAVHEILHVMTTQILKVIWGTSLSFFSDRIVWSSRPWRHRKSM
jgi:hypothetical protein